MDVPHHVECLARLALRFHATVPEVANALNMEPSSLKLKIGINSGPVIGGVIGALLPRYRIFGDTVRARARALCARTPLRGTRRDFFLSHPSYKPRASLSR